MPEQTEKHGHTSIAKRLRYGLICLESLLFHCSLPSALWSVSERLSLRLVTDILLSPRMTGRFLRPADRATQPRKRGPFRRNASLPLHCDCILDVRVNRITAAFPEAPVLSAIFLAWSVRGDLNCSSLASGCVWIAGPRGKKYTACWYLVCSRCCVYLMPASAGKLVYFRSITSLAFSPTTWFRSWYRLFICHFHTLQLIPVSYGSSPIELFFWKHDNIKDRSDSHYIKRT